MVHEMRKSIEKNIEIKFKEDLSLIQIEMNKKLDGTELNTQLEQFASKDEVKKPDIDLETQDFDNKAKKLKKFIRKIVIKELDEEEFSDDFTSDDSSLHGSELEDEMEVGDVNFKYNNESKAYLKLEAEADKSDNKEERAKISASKSKLRRKTKKLRTLEEKDLADLNELDNTNNKNLSSALNSQGLDGFKSIDIGINDKNLDLLENE